jgi:RecA-family ATPase
MLVGFHLLEEIEKAVVDNKPGLLIIDNISKLLPDAIKGDTVTEMITVLNRIRQATQCSIFVIGHTIKGNPKICIQPTDYYGSSMMQNFFAEFYFLDRTREGSYFLCHTKTKHKEEYTDSVPILTRGEHEKFGLGFRYQAIQAIDQVQLPISLQPPSKARSRNLQKFEKEIKLLLSSGCTQRQVAELCNCSQASISKLMDD